MEEGITLTVYPIQIQPYHNEYEEKMKGGMFKESIRINAETCVYRRWETTQASYTTTALAGFRSVRPE